MNGLRRRTLSTRQADVDGSSGSKMQTTWMLSLGPCGAHQTGLGPVGARQTRGYTNAGSLARI